MKKETLIYILVGVISLVLIVGGLWALEANSVKSAKELIIEGQVLTGENAVVKGSETAPVTIVEFTDFQCPACQAAQAFVNQVLAKYPDQVKLVFRHFPLSYHKQAKLAGMAAEAAGLQGKFWEMHDLIYENQQEWAEQSAAQEIFVSYASDLGLDVDQFEKDLENPALKAKIEDDYRDGITAQVNATPSFFVNGRRMKGFSVEQFEELIEKSLE